MSICRVTRAFVTNARRRTRAPFVFRVFLDLLYFEGLHPEFNSIRFNPETANLLNSQPEVLKIIACLTQQIDVHRRPRLRSSPSRQQESTFQNKCITKL